VRIAALYDVHGNLPALEAVLAAVDEARADLILVGGDVSAGPFPAESLEALRALGERVRFIRGNADRMLAAGGGGGLADAWCARQLSDEQRGFLGALPQTIVLEADEMGPVLFCHGSPRSDEETITLETPLERLRAMLLPVEERVVVCGHTHMQFERRVDLRLVVNPGSVGMPYGEPGACWALLGPGVDQQHTAYDLEQAAVRIRSSGWPQAEEFAAQNVLTVPTVEEALAFFDKVASTEGENADQL
jgi:putative phosphoesterase